MLSSGYQSRTTDNYGDETMNTAESRTIAQTETLKRVPPLPTLTKGIPSDSISWSELSSFIQWCRSNDVTVIAAFPTTMAFTEYAGSVAQNTMNQIARFYTQERVPVLGSPETFWYDYSSFYDTPYHLLDQKAAANTELLVTLARPYIDALPADPGQLAGLTHSTRY
jgi:hypothetical protein